MQRLPLGAVGISLALCYLSVPALQQRWDVLTQRNLNPLFGWTFWLTTLDIER